MIDPYNNDQIMKIATYTSADINRAKEYISTSLKSIVYPVDTLEELDRLFNEYLAMPKHSRFQSDEMCRAIFKCANRDLYELIKAQILKDSGDSKKQEIVIEPKSLPEQFLFSESVINPLDYEVLEAYIPANFTEEVAKKEAMRGEFKPNTDYNNPETELPFMTSVEIIASKAAFGDIPDGYGYDKVYGYVNYNEWFQGLQYMERGLITEDFKNQVSNWISEVRKIYSEYADATDPEVKRLKEYSLIELGWNPLMEFNGENRVKATNRFMESYNTRVIDLSMDMITGDNLLESNKLVKPLIKNGLYPVYIVLVEGKTLFSRLTKKVTKGPFSHAAISMDESLSKMYSFNMNATTGKVGGLSIENLKGYPQKHRLGVFTIFVKQKDMHTIENVLEYYISNAKKTTYSVLNVLALPFNKAIKMDFSMICSEFVDNILKLCNIKLVDKESPLVTPNDIYRASENNNRIYKIYDGPVDLYAEKETRRKIDRLRSSSLYIKESVILEMKEFPIQFSDDGDLLISNMSKLNYEAEYQKSHKLLLAYNKASNTEGMKYELSKLWFLNQLLEKDIYANKNAVANSKCRSRVLNDFNTYLNEVLKEDKSFNFTEYYNSTPFSNAVTKIKGSTLKYTIDFVKQVLKPTV